MSCQHFNLSLRIDGPQDKKFCVETAVGAGCIYLHFAGRQMTATKINRKVSPNDTRQTATETRGGKIKLCSNFILIFLSTQDERMLM